MAAQITVDVGVQLNVLQSSINELKSILSKLEIDSSSFKKVSSLIDSMSNSMQKFQTQTSKAFTSQGQFDKAQGTLEKIEETLNRTQQAIKNIKFSDLKLDNSQLDGFKQLVSNLDEAKTAYSNFLSSLKSQATAGFDLKNLGINASDMKGSLEEVQAAITRVIENAKSALTGLETKLNSTKSQLENISNLAKSASTSTSGLPSDFDKYLNKNGTGFKGGKVSGKKEIIQQLKEQFTLTDTEVTTLLNSTFNEIKQAFQEWANNADELIPDNLFSAAANRLRTKVNDFSTEVDATKAQISGLEQLESNVDVTFNTETAQAKLKELEETVEQLKARLEEYKNAQVSAATSAPAMTSASDSIKNSLQGLVTQLEQTNVAFTQMQQRVQTLNGIKQAIVNFTGFNSVMNLVKSAVKEAASTIKELDSIMNTISIVTNMTTSDLWKQVGVYSEMAQNYGVSIKGAYEVSKIYYQQGLQTNDVLNLTNETLKLCKVSGLDYATSTDYMTTALRGFKMEMSEASTIVDVYSSLASTTAVSQGELAEAMSKTASSLESVGTTFQEASSMIATMVAVTRESATNIGSALKSIAARYGELTKSTDELATDADGQVVSFNKVDKALQTVGITMQTTDGQFRSFTDVITELTGKWDQLSSTQQRYIATQFAGNRQQSRFLALVSNGDMLQQNLNTANTSEGLGTAQALKALDSLESKIQQVKTAYQQFYVSMGAENVWKAALTGITNFTNSLNKLPKLFGTIPVTAISILYSGAKTISSLLLTLVSKFGATLGNSISTQLDKVKNTAEIKSREIGRTIPKTIEETANNTNININTNFIDNLATNIASKSGTVKSSLSGILNNIKLDAGKIDVSDFKTQLISALGGSEKIGDLELQINKLETGEECVALLNKLKQGASETSSSFSFLGMNSEKLGGTLAGVGNAIALVSNFMNNGTREGEQLSGAFTAIGGAASLAGNIMTHNWVGVAMSVITIIGGITTAWENAEERAARLAKEAETLNNTAKQVKADQQTLQTGYDKLKQLETARYESAEAAKEYQTQVDNLANSFPELISGFDSAGNAIINTTSMEGALAEARKKTANATLEAIQAEIKAKQAQVQSNIDKINTASDLPEQYQQYLSGDGNDASSAFGQLKGLIKSLREGYLNLNISDAEVDLTELANAIENYFLNIENATEEEINEYNNAIDELEKIKNATDNKDVSNEIDKLITTAQTYKEAALSVTDVTKILEFLSTITPESWNDDDIREKVSQFSQQLGSLSSAEKTALNTVLEQYGLTLESLIESMNSAVSGQVILNNLSNAESSAILQKRIANKLITGLDNLSTDYSNLALMLSNQILEAWKIDGGDLSLEEFYSTDSASTIIKDFESTFNKLSKEAKEFLNQADTLSYTAEQMKQVLQNKGYYNGLNDNQIAELEAAVDSLYSNGADAIARIKEQLASSAQALEKTNSDSDGIFEGFSSSINSITTYYSDQISEKLANFINTSSVKIEQLLSSGNASEASSLSTFVTYIVDTALQAEGEQEQTLINLISQNNLNTIEGLNTAIKSLESMEGYDDSSTVIGQMYNLLKERLTQTQENVVLAYEAQLSALLETLENDSKTFSKYLSGMSATEAQSALAKAESLGLENWSIGKQIVQEGDKFVLSVEGMKDLIEAYENDLRTTAADAETAYTNLLNLGIEDTGSELKFSEITNDLVNHLVEAGRLTEEIAAQYKGEATDSEIMSQITEAANSYLTDVYQAKQKYGKDSEAAIAAMTQTAKWTIGVYDDVWKSLIDETDNAIGKIEALKNYKVGTEAYNDLDSTTKSAMQKMRSGINTLLSDYISKAGNIDWSAYEKAGIDQDILTAMKDLAENTNMTFTKYVETVVDMTDKTNEEINSLLSQAHNLDFQQKTYNALSGIVNTYNNFSYDLALKLADAANTTVENLKTRGILTVDDISGMVSASYEDLKNYLISSATEMTTEQYNSLMAQLEAAHTAETNKVSTAASEIIKNRNAVTDEQIANLATAMEKTYDEVKELLQASQNADGTYNVDLSTIQSLIESGQLKVNKETANLIANQIDNTVSSISDLFSNQSKGTTSFEAMQKAVNEINKTLGTDYDVSALYSYNEELKAYQLSFTGFVASLKTLKAQLANASDSEKEIIQQTINNQIDDLASNIDISGFISAFSIGGETFDKVKSNFESSMQNYNRAVMVFGDRNILSVDGIVSALEQGGSIAVAAAQVVAEAQGKVLSTEEVSSIYRSAVERLNTTAEQVVSAVGTVIDETAAELINKYGGSATEIGNSGKYLIQEVGNLEAIYADLIEQMSNTAGATAEDIKNLTNKVKSYNDTLISQHREVEKTITDEINSLGSAKGGDWINITQLWSTLQSQLESQISDHMDIGSGLNITAFDNLKSKLEEYGAVLDDGILKLDSDANIAGVITTLTNYAQEYGNLLQSDVAQLADTLDEVLKSFASSIETALAGSLTKSGAVDLTNMVKSLGLDNVQLDFTETVNGLKLSQQSAAQLVIELKKANNEASQLVFDKVYASLTSASGEFSTIQKTTVAIADKEREIENITAQINSLISDSDGKSRQLTTEEQNRLTKLRAQKDSLNDQLNLYKQIKKEQSKSADSYNFMGNSTPGYLDGVTNYWNSVGTAFKSMNSAASSGYMSIQDFQNIVNEMNSLAASTGNTLTFMGKTLSGKSEEAAALINSGMAALENVDGSGVQINLSKVGTNVKLGADNMQTGFTDAVKEMAASQVAMLDAAIQMLEVIVQMEALGDLDINENNTLDIGEIFTFKTDENGNATKEVEDFSEQYKKIAQNIIDLANDGNHEDLQKALQNVKINGTSMNDLLEAAKNGVDTATGKVNGLDLSVSEYTAVMTALWTAFKNGDYDLSNIDSSVWETLSNAVPDNIKIEVGTDFSVILTGGTHYTIDWTSDNVKEAQSYLEKEIGIQSDNTKTALNESLTKMATNSKDTTLDDYVVTYAAAMNSGVELDMEKKQITIDGQTYDLSDSTAWHNALRKHIASEANIENIEEKDLGDGEYSYTGTVKFGETTIEVIQDKEGNFQYKSETTGKTYSSLDEMGLDEYKQFVLKQTSNGKQTASGSLPTYEQYMYQQHQIVVDSKTKITAADGSDLNEKNKAEIEQSATELLNKGDAELKAILENPEYTTWNGNGTYTITYGNLKAQVAAGSTEELQSKIKGEITSSLSGVDLSLATSMAAGITTAFESESVKTALATAIQNGISQAVSSGFKQADTSNTIPESDVQKKMGEAVDTSKEIPLDFPNVTLKPTNLTVDTSGAATPTLSSTDTATDGVPINKVTLAPAAVEVNITGKPATLNETEIPIESATVNPTTITFTTTTATKELDVAEVTLDDIQKATATLLTLGLDTTSTTLDATSGSLDSLPNDQKVQVQSAIATIMKIDPDTTSAVFGKVTYIPSDDEKTFKVSEIFTALIQSIKAETVSGEGEGSTSWTLPENVTLPSGKTISIAEALAIIQAVTGKLGEGVTANYTGIILPEPELHVNGKIIIDDLDVEEPKTVAQNLTGLTDILSQINNEAGAYSDNVENKITTLTTAISKLGTEGTSNIKNLNAFKEQYDSTIDSLVESGAIDSSTATSLKTQGEQVIDNLIAGFESGELANSGALTTTGTTAMNSLLDALRTAAGIASPSTVTAEMGGYLVEGLVNGLQDTSSLTSAASTLMNAVTTQISTEASLTNWNSIGSQVSSDLASGLSSNKESIVTAAKTLVSAVKENLDFSDVSTSIKNVDIKSIDKATYDKTLKIEDIKEGKANVKNVTVGANAITASKTLSSLQGLDFSSTSSSLSGIKGNLDKISGASFGNFDSLKDKLVTATTQAQTLWETVQKFANQTFTVNLNQTGGTTNTTENKTTNETKNVTETKTVNTVSNTTVNVDTSGATNSTKALTNLLSSSLAPAASSAALRIKALSSEIGGIPAKAGVMNNLATAIGRIPDGTGKANAVSNLATAMGKIPDNVAGRINTIVSALKNVPTGSKSLSVQLKYSVSRAGATGNIGGFAHAKGKNEALASGRKTLMGELGPELVVSNGRYFLVGQNGAEFVNLAKDAIVFNHRQTKRLMEQGAIGSRGHAFTNENNAISLAKGKIPYKWGDAAAANDATRKNPVSETGGGTNSQKPATSSTSAKTITEKIASVSISPSQSEQIKLYSFAKGNVNGGPAMASASAALAALKEIRAAWKALSDATAKTLGSSAGKSSGSKSGSGSGSGKSGSGSGSGSSGKGSGGSGSKKSGSGGSGGSGSGSKSDANKSNVQFKSVTENIQRWYDLERQITALEKEITYQQELRNKYETDRIANGEKIYATYQKELTALKQEVDNQTQLVALQRSFYNAKQRELAESQYAKIFTYDDNGLQQYTSNEPGSKRGLDILEELTRRDANGKLIGNAENAIKQLQYLRSVGFDLSKLLYKDDGTLITSQADDFERGNFYVDKNGNVTTNARDKDEAKTQEKQATIAEEMMQVFWDQLEGWQSEMDSLWDSYTDTLKDIEENQKKQNEILQKIVDNELSIEQDIYKAVEAREQGEIDRLSETKEALSSATEKFTSGLSEQLERERNMYDKNQQSNELTKLQRQLAILERSGGSASQIRSLQEQIDSQLQDSYFNQQQEQIDAIKEASDKQIAQLETQIDIMTESLKYQKENGLLWTEVRDIMKLSTNEVMSKILEWDPTYREKSALDSQETLRDMEERYQIWDADRGAETALKDYHNALTQRYNITAEDQEIIDKVYRSAYSNAIASGDINPALTANKAASDTARGLGYHDMDTTTNAAVSQYQESFKNKGLSKEFEEQAVNEYGQEYDTAYASTFSKAYKETLTGTGAGQFGLEDITQATEEQREAALAVAQAEAEKAVSDITAKAYSNQNAEENRIKQAALDKEKQVGKYGAAFRAVGQDVIDNSGDFNTNEVFEAKYQQLRAQGKTVEEAAKEAAPEIQNIPDYASANQGAVTNTPLSAAYQVSVKKKVGKKKKWVNETRWTTVGANQPIAVTGIKNSGQTIRVNVNGYQIDTNVNNVRDLTDLEKFNLPRYRQGGLIDYTGPAIVDGSKSKPESILSAEQTKFLREDLLGNSKTSLKSIVLALQETMNGATLPSINNANSVIIESVNLTFETGTIANDYDARRAGSNIADEIMQIARKAGANTIIRR